MRFTSRISLMLLVAFAHIGEGRFSLQKAPSSGVTERRLPGSMHGKRGASGIYKDMLLRNIYTHSFLDSSGALIRAATCKFCFFPHN